MVESALDATTTSPAPLPDYFESARVRLDPGPPSVHASASRPADADDIDGLVGDSHRAFTATSHPNERVTPPDVYLLGLKKDAQSFHIFNDDYEARLPEDAYGEETAPNARVFRVYVEEAARFDRMMVNQYRDGLDVMLVFAGLFSAVVTSFLIQASQNLHADFTQISAVLLYEAASQHSATNGSVGFSVDPTRKFVPEVIDLWVNGLWAVSLTSSLVVALAVVLIKQWLHHYATLPSGTPGLITHLRHYRFAGFERWRVHVIIALLPITMHFSLALFLVGLVLFFVPLSMPLACVVVAITALVFIAYLISNILPVLYHQCPYKSPMTDFLLHACHLGWSTVGSLWEILQRSMWRDVRKSSWGFRRRAKSMLEMETDAVNTSYNSISVDALEWLYGMSSNPSVHSVVIQALSGLPGDAKPRVQLIWDQRRHIVEEARSQLLKESAVDFKRGLRLCRLERLLRSHLLLDDSYPHSAKSVFLGRLGPERVPALTRSMSSHLDATLLALSYHPRKDTGFLREFLDSYYDTEFHPLLWLTLLKMAARPVFSEVPDTISAKILSLLVKSCRTENVFDNDTQSRRVMTLEETASAEPEETVTVLLQFLAAFDDPSITNWLPDRALVAAGRHAVHLLKYQTSELDDNVKLLMRVLRAIRGTSTTSILPDGPLKNAIHRLLLDVIHLDQIYSESQELPPYWLYVREDIVMIYVKFVHSLTATTIPFSFPFFRAILSHAMAVPLGAPEIIMQAAISSGLEEAYSVFVEHRWIEHMFWHHSVKHHTLVPVILEACINGYLNHRETLSNEVESRFAEYLHEEGNLIFMVNFGKESTTRKLSRLNPTHTSWARCYASVKDLLEWRQQGSKRAKFPLQDLVAWSHTSKVPIVEYRNTVGGWPSADSLENILYILDRRYDGSST